MSSQIVIADLPDWMKQARRGVDWGVLLVMGFAFLFAWNFIQQDLSATNAHQAYLFQAADTAEALREGRLYPRWSAHAYGGYGAPLPNFYPPAAPYLAALLEVLFTNDTLLAVKLLMLFAYVFAAAMVYVLVMQRRDGLAGIVAAFLYVLSPYVGLTVPRVLGDMNEVLALALLPSVLWAVNRLLLRNQAFDFLLIALFSALLLLAAPPYFLIALVLVTVLIAIDEQKTRQKIITISAAIGVGVLCAAFYWLPALAESQAVTWLENPISATPYHINLAGLFAQIEQLDAGAMRHHPQLNLGWISLFMLGASLPVLLRYYRQSRFELAFLGLGLGLLAGTVLLFPHAIWILSPVMLCFAIAGTGLIRWYRGLQRRLKYLLLIFALADAFVVSMPIWVNIPTLNSAVEPLPLAQIESDWRGLGTASVVAGQAIPSNLASPLSMSLRASYLNDFLNRASTSRFITGAREYSHEAWYQVLTTEELSFVLERAYFEGWRATLNDQDIPVERDEATGLIRLSLAANSSGDLHLWFGTSPIRAFSWLLTAFGLALIALISWQRRQHCPFNYDLAQLLELPYVRALAVTFVLAALLRLSPYGEMLLARLQLPMQYRLQDTQLVRAQTDDGILLRAYQIDRLTYRQGETVQLALFWDVLRQIEERYQVQLSLVHLENLESATTVWQSPFHDPADYPTPLWQAEGYLEERYDIPIPAASPLGTYQLHISLYLCETLCLEQIPFQSTSHNLLDGKLILLEFEIAQ